MVDAIKVSTQLPGWRPKTFSNSWPKYRDEWGDLIAQAGSPDDPDVLRAARDARPARSRPSSMDIELMEEASGWIGAYIGVRTTIALSLQIWLLGSAFGLKRGSLAMKRGLEPGHVK